MIEYTLDSLVHLYDSLNNQIEILRNDLSEFNKIGTSQNLTDEYRAEIEEARKRIEKRFEKLTDMRDATERLLHTLLNEELKGL